MPEIRPLRCFSSSHKVLRLCGSPVFLGRLFLGKLLSIGDGLTAALSSPWLSFHPTDLLIGIAGAVVLRMAVYLKGKNAKKYRHGIEYGSARWSA